MAVTFSDLHTESGLKSLDCFLSGKAYISGDNLTRDDIKVYAAVLVKPGGSFPNASKWYDAVSSQLAASFPGKAVGVRVSGKAAPAKEAEVGCSLVGMERVFCTVPTGWVFLKPIPSSILTIADPKAVPQPSVFFFFFRDLNANLIGSRYGAVRSVPGIGW
ncbi:Elongation factor 1-beta 1 [Fagus crenata]